MANVKLCDVIRRANIKVDKDNTDLVYYVGGEHIESENIRVRNRGLIAGSYNWPHVLLWIQIRRFFIGIS